MSPNTNLTDVSGIGPKTSDRLAEIGITDIDTFCRAYFLHPAHTVADILRSTKRVHRHFIQHPPESLDAECLESIPAPASGVIAGMAFAREFGCEYTHTPSHKWSTADEQKAIEVTPDDIDWDDGVYLADPQKNFGIYINPDEEARDDGEFDPAEAEQPPTARRDVEDGRIAVFETPTINHRVDTGLLERVEEFMQVTYADDQLADVATHPEVRGPLHFQTGGPHPFVVAPLIPNDDEDEEAADEEAAEAVPAE